MNTRQEATRTPNPTPRRRRFITRALFLAVGFVATIALFWLVTDTPPRTPTLSCRDAPSVRIDGRAWCYERSGDGPEHLVVLMGGLGSAPTIPEAFRTLGPEYSVWALVHPPLRSLQAVSEGIVDFLDRMELARVDLFGASLGGAVAQAVVRAVPERVDRVVLANTSPPIGSRSIGLFWAVVRRAATLLPDRLVEGWVQGKLEALVPESDGHERAAMGLDRMTAAHAYALGDLLVDFHRQSWSPSDLASWQGRVLIIESKDDPMIPARYRKKLRELYPGATVHSFEAAGHLPSLSRPAEFRRVTTSFLKSERP